MLMIEKENKIMRTKNAELMNKMLDYINSNFEKTGRTPTYREIAKEFSITSGCVSNYIKEMAEKNMLENSSGSRGIKTLKMQKSNSEIEQLGVVGTIACGSPMYAGD